jgi:hypothetical protein
VKHAAERAQLAADRTAVDQKIAKLREFTQA